MLEKALENVRQQELNVRDYTEQKKLQHQMSAMEHELTNIRQDLAYRSKVSKPYQDSKL